jgi:hypothetical protein
VATSSVSRIRRAVSAIAVASAIGIGAVLVPATASPASAITYCGIRPGYMCIYLNVAGDGSGNVTFESYTIGTTTTPLSFAPCVRQGGISSGTCVLQVYSTSATSVTISIYMSASSDSCYSYQGGSCQGAGATKGRTFTWVNGSVGDGDVSFSLLSPEALNLTLAGTGTGTVVSTPRGINCPGKCSADFPAGSSVQLTATPASGDTFAGYTGPPCAGSFHSPSCSWVINSTLNITATFTLPVTPPPPTPTPTPKPTTRPTPTPRPTPTLAPGATPRPVSAPTPATASEAIATPTAAASDVASAAATPGPEESPSEGASLVPIATPSTSPVSSSGGDGPVILIPIGVAILAVAGYLLIQRLRRT